MTTEIILYADSESGYLAELKVRYSWNLTGTEFTCTALQYRATNNGRKSGNAYLRIVIDGKNNDSGDFLNDNGVQDGQWHNIQNKSWTIRNVVGILAQLIFTWTFDITGSGDKYLGPNNPPTVVFKPRPPHINPIKNFTASPIRVTGIDGIPGFTLRVYRNYTTDTDTASIATNGTWSANLRVADGISHMVINSHQFKGGGAQSDYSNGFHMYRAVINSPANGEVVPLKDLVFEGGAAPGTLIRVLRAGGTVLSVQVTTDAWGNWRAAAQPDLSLGNGDAVVTAEMDGRTDEYTNARTIKILGYPSITNTQLTVPLGFTLTGRNRLSGATLTAYIGASNTAVGTAVAATTDTFSITTNNLDPGAHALTVEQFHSGKGSGRSAAVTFNVKPEQPTVTSTITGERVKLHGTGFRGGQVHFHQPGNGNTPLFSVDIQPNGTFEYDVPQTQLPGSLHYSCRQSVAGVGAARIYSDGWVQLQTSVPVPAPTQLTSSRDGQKLVISGRGLRWGATAGKVVIFNNGQDMGPGVPAVEVPVNLAWTTRSTADVAPGNYTQLTAKMWVNNLYSQPVPVPAVIIPSPPPVLTPFTAPTGQRPQIRGTMWSGSKVEVQINGGPAKTATTTGASFHLDATSDWAPATYTVSVTAEFGGQTSTPSTQSLTVRAPQPKILTTGAVPLQATIIGDGWPGCRVRIFTTIGNQELGADNVKSDGKFEIALLKQAAGDQTLYAVQYQSDNPANASVESERVAVKFGMPMADITVPPEGGMTPRVSTFSGTTTARSGTVELWLESVSLRTNIAITSGNWSASGINLAAGPKAVEVYIRDGGDLSAATIRNVKVVPEKLKIDSPLTNQYIGRQLRISGVVAFPGDSVIVQRLGAPFDFPPVTVDESGHWTANVQHNMVAGNTIAAIARAGAGLDSEASDPIISKLLHTAPHITQPQAGDRVGTKPVFSGLARPEATVTIAQWFNNTIVLATITADTDGYWEVQSSVELAEGGGWVLVRDTLNAQPSEWRKSERFEVKAAVVDFAAPILGFPQETQEVGLQPVLSGRGLPGAKVIAYKSGAGSEVLGEFLVARDGNWQGALKKQFPPGDFGCTLRQQRDGAYSKWMVPDRMFNAIQVPAGFAKPVIIKPVNNPAFGIEPNPEITGTGFPGATLKVYFHATTTVIAETTVQPNGHWVTRCKSDLAEGPHQLAAQQELDGKVSAWSGIIINVNVRANLTDPVCTSPTDGEDVSSNLVLRGRAMPGAELDLYWLPGGNYLEGVGIANKDGFWIIKVYGLPPGESSYKARARFGGVVSGWTREIKVNIQNFG
ncbi:MULTISPECIES: hypothetical protein [unclassified Pseudomonas]|uniref:hypothetical protein n=1 Tax=unclassified Pseudomonas TaxID=196821 RepID=UPI00200D9F42|nr:MULTISPECIES: hypothetical protein [unclassified Pseudomonas]